MWQNDFVQLSAAKNVNPQLLAQSSIIISQQENKMSPLSSCISTAVQALRSAGLIQFTMFCCVLFHADRGTLPLVSFMLC